MKCILSFSLMLVCIAQSFAESRDTMYINGSNLVQNSVKYGDLSYLVYNKTAKESAATGFYVANIHVASTRYHDKPAIAISQSWEARDTFAHTAYTVLNATDFSTLYHTTFWKGLGYTSQFDFDAHKVSFDGRLPDSVRVKIVSAFDSSFNEFNLNWHSDLFLFPLLPFKKDRSFAINFYDPGVSAPQVVVYDIVGEEKISSWGTEMDCWIMLLRHGVSDYQKFWIAKKDKVVVREEDFFAGKYRFKIKLAVPENIK